MRLRVIAILNTKGSDYCSIVNLISKNGAIKPIAKCWFDQKKIISIYKNG